MASQAIRSAGGTFLTRVLQVNAAITGVLGVVFAGEFQALAVAFGLHPTVILAFGMVCVLTAAAIAWVVATGRVSNQVALVLAGIEVGWGVLSVAALVFGWLAPTPLGWWAIVFQADIAVVFAALEFYAVRKAQRR